MEENGNTGAHTPVTVAKAPSDLNNLLPKESSRRKGACACNITKLLLLTVTILVIVIIITIIIAVVFSKNSSAAKQVATTGTAPTMSQEMKASSSLPIAELKTSSSVPIAELKTSSSVPIAELKTSSSVPIAELTTTPVTTFGPPVVGYFSGWMVLQREFLPNFDDERDTVTVHFKLNVTTAMDQFYADVGDLYTDTTISLLKNGTYVRVDFTVTVSAIGRGVRRQLVDAVATTPSNKLNTYTVLQAEIEEEQAGVPPA